MTYATGQAHRITIEQTAIQRALDETHASSHPRALDGICHSAHHGPVERFGERFEFIAMQLREAAIAHKTGLRKHGEANLIASRKHEPLGDPRDVLRRLSATGSQWDGSNAQRGNRRG